jgi:hypothetical protein
MMKKITVIALAAAFMLVLSANLISQSTPENQEFGITTGAFTNFPANENYLDESMSVFYLAPYVRTGKHEFSLGIVYQLEATGLFVGDHNINPMPGAMAGYKFYVFDILGRENMFIHYSFQYLRFRETYDRNYVWSYPQGPWTETDMYINNVIGLGYSLFFDHNERFGMYYILDYVISQRGYKITAADNSSSSWKTSYAWNNISTQIGFSFKLAPLKKKAKK